MVATAVLVVATGLRAPAHAQLGIARSDQSVLVLWPVVGANRRNTADTALAVQIGDQLREKLDVKERFKMRVHTRARICEILIGSGYKCPEMLDPDNAERLAGVIGPDAYIVGLLTRNSRPTLHLRLVDVKKTGISGWVNIVGDTNWKADQFASVAVDSIDSALRGAEAAHDCYDRLDHNDVKGAREKVNDAFKVYPNQPSAALCLVRVFETNRAPVDSIIFALQRATRGDSMSAKAWERLANAYLEKNDMAHAVEARTMQLNATPRNATLRFQVAAGWIEQKQYQKGVDLLDVGLQDNPLDIQMLSLKQRACVDGQLWKCALSSLSALYDADTMTHGDSVFYAKIFGAAQSLNDTTAMLKWSAEAVKRIPNSLTMWRARAAALSAAGRGDSAMVAYQRVIQYDTTDVPVTLRVAQGLATSFSVDTAAGVDVEKVRTIDTYLRRASTMSTDSTVRSSAAQLYAVVGLKIAASKKNDELSDSLLNKALAGGLHGRALEQASFYLGFHIFQRAIQGMPGAPGYPDQIQKLSKTNPPRALTAAENAKGCQLLAEELAAVARAKPLITTGRSVIPQTTAMLNYLNTVETQAPAVKRFFKCTN